jgi:hypothetical protein
VACLAGVAGQLVHVGVCLVDSLVLVSLSAIGCFSYTL